MSGIRFAQRCILDRLSNVGMEIEADKIPSDKPQRLGQDSSSYLPDSHNGRYCDLQRTKPRLGWIMFCGLFVQTESWLLCVCSHLYGNGGSRMNTSTETFKHTQEGDENEGAICLQHLCHLCNNTDQDNFGKRVCFVPCKCQYSRHFLLGTVLACSVSICQLYPTDGKEKYLCFAYKRVWDHSYCKLICI